MHSTIDPSAGLALAFFLFIVIMFRTAKKAAQSGADGYIKAVSDKISDTEKDMADAQETLMRLKNNILSGTNVSKEILSSANATADEAHRLYKQMCHDLLKAKESQLIAHVEFVREKYSKEIKNAIINGAVASIKEQASDLDLGILANLLH